MSVSSRDVDEKTGETKKHSITPDDDDGRKYVRIWRIEASKEFILLMLVLTFAVGTSLYNPFQLVQNTDKIIFNQDRNYGKLGEYINTTDKARTDSGIDIIKVLLLYQQDMERDISKLMSHHNISNTHFVKVNGTHVITEGGSFRLPYMLDLNVTNPNLLADNATPLEGEKTFAPNNASNYTIEKETLFNLTQ